MHQSGLSRPALLSIESGLSGESDRQPNSVALILKNLVTLTFIL